MRAAGSMPFPQPVRGLAQPPAQHSSDRAEEKQSGGIRELWKKSLLAACSDQDFLGRCRSSCTPVTVQVVVGDRGT